MSLGRVLVIDDDKNTSELLRLFLEKEGFGVIMAYDGEEGLIKFNALKPDIILLDIMLPGIDGWQVCREIRKKSNPARPWRSCCWPWWAVHYTAMPSRHPRHPSGTDQTAW